MADDALPTGENLAMDDREADDLARKLRKGKLPQMVDWFDPLVLGSVGIRTLISTTIGEYADQRPMQEAADGEPVGKRLVTRHDFSKTDGDEVVPPDADPENLNFATRREKGDQDAPPSETDLARTNRRLKLDSGAFWVDFIADLGDGFEATYAMAYLLAAERLQVGPGVLQELPAGQILIWGGDLAYPNATLEEYRRRCLDPYDWAFSADAFKQEPDRELFFVAGNHDWYDGLSAFTTQFCYEASSVGAWRCRQERSYFALRLPYDWWIWGIDVALGDNIDVGQLHYFQGVVESECFSEKLNPKVIVILHAPDWTKPSYKALTKICELVRQRGEVCAIIAGDLHHYSRYQSVEPAAAKGSLPRDQPLHLITSGGGGAFAHPTHDRANIQEIEPAVATRRIRGMGQALRVEKKEEGKYRFRYTKFYPSRGRSRMLTLKNLWLPFRNWRFALLLGFVYLLYAWVFNIAAPKDAVVGTAHTGMNVGDAAAVATAAQNNPAFFFMLLGLWVGLIAYVDANLSNRFLKWLNMPSKLLFGTLHYSAHVMALLYVSAFSMVLAATIFNPLIGAIALSGNELIGELLQAISFTRGREAELATVNSCLAAIDWSAGGSLGRDCARLLQKSAFYITATALASAAITILIGGFVGGSIFGCYWVITSALFGMHPDAFSALAIKDYKNFLRMKFEKDKLTIYPIALDRVPGPKEWRPWRKSDYKDPNLKHRPLLVPKRDMKPRLIEGPIEIHRANQPPYADVKAYRPRGEG